MKQKYYKKSYTYDILELEKAEKLFKRLTSSEEWFKPFTEDIEGKNALAEMGREYFTKVEYLSILCYLAYKRFSGGVVFFDKNNKKYFRNLSYEVICLQVLSGIMETFNRGKDCWIYTNLETDETGELLVKGYNRVYKHDLSYAYESITPDLSNILSYYGKKYAIYEVPGSVKIEAGAVNKMIEAGYAEIVSEININFI